MSSRAAFVAAVVAIAACAWLAAHVFSSHGPAAMLLPLVFVFVLGKPLYHGLAVGLLILAALGLTIDYYAEARAVRYAEGLEASSVLSGR